MILKQLKYVLFFLLTFLFGTQSTYAKTALTLTQNQLSFSIEQNQSVNSIEKEVQPNIGVLIEKSRFVVSKGVSAQNPYNFSGISCEYLANGVGVNSLDDFLALTLSNKLDNIVNGWTAYYPQIFFERRLFEDMMGYYRYLKNAGWGHTGDIAHNFKAIDFYYDFTKVGDDIFANTAVSMKTTTTTNVDNWLNSNAIKNNLDNLEDGIITGNGITWNGTTIKYTNAEVHIYMPQAKFTPQIKTQWLNKLATERPSITFKINILEDFVN